MTRPLVLLAGPSGSGKSRLVAMAGIVGFRLDDFYLDHDAPGLPRGPLGIPDWDDVGSWDLDGAAGALQCLVENGHATMPVYDISTSRRIGAQTLTADDGALVIAEGIFALDLLPELRRRGLAVEPVYLDRPRALTFWLRLARDLREHRKRPSVLLRRGLSLMLSDPALRRRALAAGFRPLSMRAAVRLLSSLPLPDARHDPDSDD